MQVNPDLQGVVTSVVWMRSPAVRRVRIAVVVAAVLGGGLLVAAAGGSARAQVSITSDTAPPSTAKPTTDKSGVQHLKFEYGPLEIRPGQNVIDTNKYLIPQPKQDGWIVGFKPNLRLPNGKVPPVDVIHLHHGVWANALARDATYPLFPERFIAAGEEKTALELPPGYGYRYRPTDAWYLNYMIHDLTPKPFKVFLTYDVDFVPATSPLADGMKDVHPIWLDVQNGKVYPVFDVLKGSGTDGKFTYPDDDPERASHQHLQTADRRRAGEDVRPSASRRTPRHVLGDA